MMLGFTMSSVLYTVCLVPLLIRRGALRRNTHLGEDLDLAALRKLHLGSFLLRYSAFEVGIKIDFVLFHDHLLSMFGIMELQRHRRLSRNAPTSKNNISLMPTRKMG